MPNLELDKVSFKNSSRNGCPGRRTTNLISFLLLINIS